MPKVAYSEEDRRRVREELLTTALKLMSTQGIQHTTVEQVYRSVGISRSFFYAFFPAKEDLIVEALYLQQPRLLEYARSPDGRPDDQLAGRGAAVPGYLLLWRQEWGGGAQRG